MIKKIFIALFVCINLISFAKQFSIKELEKILPNNIASIDNKNITKSEFIKYLMQNLAGKKFHKLMSEEKAKFMIVTIAEKMVSEKIIDEIIKSKNITTTSKELEDFYATQLKSLTATELEVIKKRYRNLDAWIKSQAKNKENISSFNRYKYLKKEFIDKAKIDEGKIRAYYNSNAIRFKEPQAVDVGIITCNYNPRKKGSKELAKKRIDSIAIQLQKAPNDFAKIAKEKSDCYSKKNGGRLGFLYRNMLNINLEKEAFALKENSNSKIIELNNSYNILHCYKHRAERKIGYDEVKPLILDMLKRKEAEVQLTKFLNSEKARLKVTMFLKYPKHQSPVFEEKKDEKK